MTSPRLAQLSQRLKRAQGSANVQQLADQYLAEGIITVLGDQRLVGEVLLGLPHLLTTDAPGTLALIWQGDDLALLAHPLALAQVDPDQLVALLKHEALHVIWRHPLRYADQADLANVKVACDIAVNQYLDVPPAGTATLADLRKLVHQPVKAGQDSAAYLRIIRDNHLQLNGHLNRTGQSLNGDNQSVTGVRPRSGNPTKRPLDSHHGWLVSTDKVGQLRLPRSTHLQQILTQAWQKTPAHQRGLLPGAIQQELRPRRLATRPRWVRQLRTWLGSVPHGKQDSRARFNRRQPYRMELPGRVTRYVSQLQVFIDNSGSMGDDEISNLLSQVNLLAQEQSMVVTVIPFDAQIHPEGIQQLNQRKRVKYQRSGGGGTRFQSIFDYLKKQSTAKNAQVLIMTDGWGERAVNTFDYRHVVWLLTTATTELSIVNPPGKVITTKGDQ